MDIRLSYVKVGSDERDEDGIEDVIDKLVHNLQSFADIRL
jgi:hypothetical protein